jgi:hypothetical protein
MQCDRLLAEIAQVVENPGSIRKVQVSILWSGGFPDRKGVRLPAAPRWLRSLIPSLTLSPSPFFAVHHFLLVRT